ncbi:hypothetical protein [Pseudomonas lini]
MRALVRGFARVRRLLPPQADLVECDITQPIGLTEAGKAAAKIIRQKKAA